MQPIIKRSPAEAYRVVEEIQKLYYLHPDDILFRQQNPRSPETYRQDKGIKRLEGTLDL
jgi:hypothetical protein